MGPQLKNQDGNYTYRVRNINKEVSLPLKKFVCKKNKPALKAHDFRYKPFLYFDLNYKGKKKEGRSHGWFADVITKAALTSQFFKDPEFWSGRGSNPRHTAQQTGTYPPELTS